MFLASHLDKRGYLLTTYYLGLIVHFWVLLSVHFHLWNYVIGDQMMSLLHHSNFMSNPYSWFSTNLLSGVVVTELVNVVLSQSGKQCSQCRLIIIVEMNVCASHGSHMKLPISFDRLPLEGKNQGVQPLAEFDWANFRWHSNIHPDWE